MNTENMSFNIYAGIPAYNSAECIKSVLNGIVERGIVKHIIVVDDGSKDNTCQTVKEFKFDELTIIQHKENRGYGAALKTLFNVFSSKANPEDIMVIVHGDNQTPPDEIPNLTAPFNDLDVDVVLGSRMLGGIKSQYGKRPIYKIVCDFILTSVQNMLYVMQLSTYASGYRAFRKQAIDKLDYQTCHNRHIFDTEILIKSRIVQLNLKEIKVRTVKSEGVSNNALIKYAASSIKLMVKYGFRVGG